MRKCHECNETKGLKSIQVPYCDDETHNHLDKDGYPKNASICHSCYVLVACGGDEEWHDVDDCLQDPECPNHKHTKELCENWDNYDYYWKLKKQNETTEINLT